MYWQKRFNRESSDQELEKKVLEIRKNNKDFVCRRIYGTLRKQGLIVNGNYYDIRSTYLR